MSTYKIAIHDRLLLTWAWFGASNKDPHGRTFETFAEARVVLESVAWADGEPYIIQGPPFNFPRQKKQSPHPPRPTVDPSESRAAFQTKPSPAKPQAARRQRQCERNDCEAIAAQADEAFAEWWQDVGCLKSEQIAVTLVPQTPQEWMRDLFIDAYTMGICEGT